MATAPDVTAGTTGGPLTITASTPGVVDPAAYQLTVQQPPAITSVAAATFTEGQPGTFTITASGYPTPTITATSALPAGLTLTDNGDGTATISGTPAAGTAGSYRITIDVENGVTDPTQTLTLTIRAAAAPNPPTPADDGPLPFTGATPGPVLAARRIAGARWLPDPVRRPTAQGLTDRVVNGRRCASTRRRPWR